MPRRASRRRIVLSARSRSCSLCRSSRGSSAATLFPRDAEASDGTWLEETAAPIDEALVEQRGPAAALGRARERVRGARDERERDQRREDDAEQRAEGRGHSQVIPERVRPAPTRVMPARSQVIPAGAAVVGPRLPWSALA